MVLTWDWGPKDPAGHCATPLLRSFDTSLWLYNGTSNPIAQSPKPNQTEPSEIKPCQIPVHISYSTLALYAVLAYNVLSGLNNRSAMTFQTCVIVRSVSKSKSVVWFSLNPTATYSHNSRVCCNGKRKHLKDRGKEKEIWLPLSNQQRKTFIVVGGDRSQIQASTRAKKGGATPKSNLS